MKAKVESPVTSKTSAEKKTASDAVTAADVQNGEAAAAAETTEVKAEEAPAPKKRGRKPGVKTTAAKKETAKKETVKKTSTKKTTAKKTSKAASAAKSTAKKAEEQIVIQFAGRECTKEDLVNRINEIWTNDYGKKASEMKKVAFYVKTEEFAVYYVINDDITGKFDI